MLQVIVFRGQNIKGSNVTIATGNSQNTIVCRLIVFWMWHQKEASNAAGWLFCGGCKIKEGNITNAAGNMEPTHQCHRLFFVPSTWLQRRAMLQVSWFFGRCSIRGMLPMVLEWLSQTSNATGWVFLMWDCRRPAIPQANFLGAWHQRRKHHQCYCKHRTKPLLAQIDCFFGCGIKGGQQCCRLFLGGHSIGWGNIANAAGNMESNHQCCRWNIVFWHGIVEESNAAGWFF